MVLEFVSGVGPFQSNTDQPYAPGAGTFGDVGITITTVDGKDHFRWTGAATAGEYRVITDDASETPDSGTDRWWCFERFRIQGTFGAVGDEVEVFRQAFNGWQFFLLCQTDTSHYVWRMKVQGATKATGTTEFAVGTTFHSGRLAAGVTNKMELYIDGTKELSSNDVTGLSDIIALFVDTTLQNGQTIEIHNIQICQGDLDDRPDHQNMDGGILTLTGDKVSAQYADEADCGNTGAGTYTNWNDWESGDADDATSYNCGKGVDAMREVSDMSDPATTDLYGVSAFVRNAASGASKTVAWDIILEDAAGNIRSVAQTNLNSETFANRGRATFGRGPGIAGWTEAKLDETGVGTRTPNTNDADDFQTAIMAEWFGIGADPPAADRRRILAQVV